MFVQVGVKDRVIRELSFRCRPLQHSRGIQENNLAIFTEPGQLAWQATRFPGPENRVGIPVHVKEGVQDPVLAGHVKEPGLKFMLLAQLHPAIECLEHQFPSLPAHLHLAGCIIHRDPLPLSGNLVSRIGGRQLGRS